MINKIVSGKTIDGLSFEDGVVELVYQDALAAGLVDQYIPVTHLLVNHSGCTHVVRPREITRCRTADEKEVDLIRSGKKEGLVANYKSALELMKGKFGFDYQYILASLLMCDIEIKDVKEDGDTIHFVVNNDNRYRFGKLVSDVLKFKQYDFGYIPTQNIGGTESLFVIGPKGKGCGMDPWEELKEAILKHLGIK